MNNGDDIKISAIVTSFDENVSVRARIKGIKKIKIDDNEYDKQSELISQLTFISSINLVFCITVFVVYTLMKLELISPVLFPFIGFILGVVGALLITFTRRRKR